MKTIQAPVSNIMSRELVVIKPEDNLRQVDQLFMAYNIHHLPVVDEDGKLCGLITRNDYARAGHLLGHFQLSYDQVLVKNLMSQQLATAAPDTPISEVAQVFLSNVMHALPIVEKGELLGLVTTHDLLRYLLEERKLLAGQG